MYEKEGLDKVVYRTFITGFYSCSYSAGEVLDPAELAERYGVSRTPVVQALKLLANERIIGVGGNGRFFIHTPTEADLRGICRTRVLFEQEAVRRLIRSKNLPAVDNLCAMADQCLFETETDNSVESVKRDMDFHRTLIASAKNSCMQELYEIVLNRYISVKYVLRDQYRSQRKAGQRHVELMHFIERGNVEAAEKCIDDHISIAMEYMIQIIRSNEAKAI